MMRILAAVVVCSAVGCSSPTIKLVPAQGRLVLKTGDMQNLGIVVPKADPIANAIVEFVPDSTTSGNICAQGKTDLNGYFFLETSPHGRGAMSGDYRIVVNMPANSVQRIDDRYKHADSTPFSTTIPNDGMNQLLLVVK